jgi:hypothetical protein
VTHTVLKAAVPSRSPTGLQSRVGWCGRSHALILLSIQNTKLPSASRFDSRFRCLSPLGRVAIKIQISRRSDFLCSHEAKHSFSIERSCQACGDGTTLQVSDDRAKLQACGVVAGASITTTRPQHQTGARKGSKLEERRYLCESNEPATFV